MVLLQIFSWLCRWKKFKNWPIFAEVIRRTKNVSFWGGTPCKFVRKPAAHSSSLPQSRPQKLITSQPREHYRTFRCPCLWSIADQPLLLHAGRLNFPPVIPPLKFGRRLHHYQILALYGARDSAACRPFVMITPCLCGAPKLRSQSARLNERHYGSSRELMPFYSFQSVRML